MSRLLLILFFLLGVMAGAMVLGPVIYFAVNLVAAVPFHRAMDRALLISAVAGVGLCGTRIPWGKIWPLSGDAWKELLIGVFIAAVTAQAIIGFDLATAGFTSAHLGAGKVAARVALALFAGLVAPFLEETVFRGFLQRELAEGVGWIAGLIVASLIFALAHFLKIPVELDRQPVHVWSGVTALGAAFASVGHDLARPENVLKAANLFVLGLVLGGVFQRTGTLWLNAGLHGGLIFALLLFTGLTRPVEPPSVAGFGGDILSSPATMLVLLLLGFWLWRFYRHPSIVPETGPA